MAITGDNAIDFASIAAEMRKTVASWYNAEIEIVDPNTEQLDSEWDFNTNSIATNVETVIWSGKARIQPIRSALNADLDIAQSAVQAVRVQVPYDADLSLIRKGMQVKIISGGEDIVLESLQLVVRSAINSSYGWNRTIECDVDTKSVANG